MTAVLFMCIYDDEIISMFTLTGSLAGVTTSVPFCCIVSIFLLKESCIGWNGSDPEIFSKTNLNFCCFLMHRISNTNFDFETVSFPSTILDQFLHLIMLSRSAPNHWVRFHRLSLGFINRALLKFVVCEASVIQINRFVVYVSCLRVTFQVW